MTAIETAYMAVACHLLGDYPLQIDFIANSKRDNPYHMFVHVLTYTVPFAVAFGIDWRIAANLAVHFVTDEAKAHGKIPYWLDQAIHYVTVLCLYVLLGVDDG